MPRPGCIEVITGKGGASYRLTDLGLAQIMELAALGSSKAEIADYLRVSAQWLGQQLDKEDGDPQALDAYQGGLADFKKRLRTAQANLSDVNATMAIWLGKQHLGQHEVQSIEVNKKIQVVGTMPNYQLTAEDWAKQFVPAGAAPMLQDKRADAIDAEVVDVENEP